MKMIKKVALTAAGIASIGLVNAQKLSMKNMIKVGANAGVVVPSGNASFALGLDAGYQHLVTPSVGLGIATGYTHYFGKENTINNQKIKNNDFGVVPLAALLRIYPQKTGFYFGTDLGYGFITGNNKVAKNHITATERPDGGLYIKPEIGFHNDDWNFSIQYQKVFTGNKGKLLTQKYSAGNIGVGVSYNIPLGK